MSTGKYRVSINGFTCLNSTRDDLLNYDGNGDEVYFVVNTKIVKGTDGTVLLNSNVSSKTMGDTHGWAGRIQAGSGSSLWYGQTGGIMTNDSYPSNQPWLRTTDPTGRDFPPYTIWEGELTKGSQDVIFLTPTIWEYDTGGDLVNAWINWHARTDATFGGRAKEIYGGIWPVARPFFDAISLAIQTLATLTNDIWSPVGSPFSRPIGLQRDPANPQGAIFNPLILALTYDMAEYLVNANPFGLGQGIIGHSYLDDPFFKGDYQIWLQIDKIGGKDFWPDGSVVRETSDPKVYVIYGNAKFWIPDAQTFVRLFPQSWATVKVVPDGTLAPLSVIAKDGTILREETSAYVWLMQHGTKRHITTPAVLNKYGGWKMVRVVPNLALASIPAGQPVS